MSVPKSKRQTSTLEVLTKSRKLALYTIKICNNENNFPKRYRWCLTNEIIKCSINISEYIAMANSIYVVNDGDYYLRRSYQQRALSSTTAMLNIIQIAYETLNTLDEKKVLYWIDKTMEVQASIRAWKKSDENKYG